MRRIKKKISPFDFGKRAVSCAACVLYRTAYKYVCTITHRICIHNKTHKRTVLPSRAIAYSFTSDVHRIYIRVSISYTIFSLSAEEDRRLNLKFKFEVYRLEFPF